MAARTQSRPLSAVFLERVIRIDAVQRHRTQATDEYASGFFDAGRLLGELDDFRWPLDAPELLSQRGGQFLGVINARGFTSSKEKEVSPAMQTAWDAAVAAWGAFVSELRNGDYIATATDPATGERRDLEPAEWMRSGSVLDVYDGDLFRKERGGQLIPQWTSITLRPAEPVRAAIPERNLGRIDWDDWWKHEIDRRKQGLLPNKKDYLQQAEPLIKERYGVATVPPSELRRIKAALYRGDSERPKRPKRKQPKRKR